MYPGPWDHIRIYVGSVSFIMQQLVQSEDFARTISVQMHHAHKADKLKFYNTYDRRTVEKTIDRVWKDLKQYETDPKMLRYLKDQIVIVAAPKSGIVLEVTDKHCDTVGVSYKYTPYPREQHENEPPIPVKNVKELLEIIKLNCRFITVETLK